MGIITRRGYLPGSTGNINHPEGNHGSIGTPGPGYNAGSIIFGRSGVSKVDGQKNPQSKSLVSPRESLQLYRFRVNTNLIVLDDYRMIS